ncbi:phosphatase PAP2 family protein [Lacticaseibacillus sp. N501-2]|uniref:phosphatase PAP2 family protein n=1 Tax=Lacticaseibacillus salsurae TaxID=3367729 RepID=UPI0038B40F53
MTNQMTKLSLRQRKLFIPIALIALALALPLIIGVYQHVSWLTVIDAPIVKLVCSTRPHWLTTVLLVITTLGDPLSVTLIAAAVALLLWWQRRREQALFVLSNVLVMSGVNHLLKQWLQRPRPFIADPSIHPLTAAGGFSFPSGHSAGAMLLYGSLILLTYFWPLTKKWAWGLRFGFGAMIFLTGYSRIYVQVHYPTDVAAGWLLALCGICLLAYWWWPILVQTAQQPAPKP